MELSVTVDGVVYECSSDDPNSHQGDTCPIHEDKDSPAYAPTLCRDGFTEEDHDAAFDSRWRRSWWYKHHAEHSG